MEQISKIMYTLGLDYKQATDLLKDDRKIETGGRCSWEVSIEEEKRLRKMYPVDVDRRRIK